MASVVVGSVRKQLYILDKLMAVASASENVAVVLDRSLGVILEATGARVGGVILVEGDGLQLVAHQGLAPDKVAALRSLSVRSMAWSAQSESREIVAMGGNGAHKGPVERLLAEIGCRSVVIMPLVARDRTLGWLFVCALSTEQPPSAGSETRLDHLDNEFLNILGRAIGLAVDNSRLYQQMSQRLRESQALSEVSRALVSTLDLDALLNLIVRSAVDTVTKANNAVLHLLNEETGELLPRALSFVGEVRPRPSGRLRMHVGQGVAGYALELGQAVNIPDVSRDPRFLRVEEARSFASMLVAPLKLGKRSIGTLSIDSNEPYAFSADDERVLMTLATQATTAIENARLVHDLQQSVHDLKTTQQQLIQSEKLSAIGQLIAGVAHELNNPLTAVMGYAQLLQTTEDLDEGVLRDLDKIYAQAQRAAKIVQNLLTFARQHKEERQFVDVNEVLERTLEIRAYQLRVENIEVITQLNDHVLGTMADPNQLQQVFLNLINNAQDAMTEARGGGHLIVTSELINNVIRVKVIDDGPGLSPEVQKRLFEPFFTTKEVGKGTGLGLSICFGIVSQYGGRIWAESGENKGATFCVELPAVSDRPLETRRIESVHQPLPRSRTVLVVEDEEEVAALLERVLLQDGHRVLLAHDGRSALTHLTEARKQGAIFDLVISDIKMPGLSGPALYNLIRQQEPDLVQRMIFVTGDTLNPATQGFLRRASLPHLSKPFTIGDLRQTMTRVLGD